MTVWVVLDITEWSRDIVGVFATRDAAISAMDRTSSWGFSLEEWVVEGGDHAVGSASGAGSANSATSARSAGGRAGSAGGSPASA
ncbi:hypothetical protein [Herbiconiux solani]|uniref:hypothetical protein n=1 Tax=Herbiconiux solani TaxID=661329 RepID=UPI0012EDB66B|nr:hypothetical protein [Herbiconiux solani]